MISGFLLFDNYYQQPKEQKAFNEMYTAQKYFDEAVLLRTSDSLFNLSLNGDDNNFGMLEISEIYSNTKAGNLANYYAGMAFMNIKDYAKAIEYLNKFNSNDDVLSAMAKGGIGDAFVQLEQFTDAYDYYLTAAKIKTNNYTTPFYFFKAGILALKFNEKGKALECFNAIKFNFPNSAEAKDIDIFIGKAQVISN